MNVKNPINYKFNHYVRKLITIIDNFTEWTGCIISWATLLMVFLTGLIVFMRYFFEVGSIALQESLTYLHALVFLMGAGFTLKRKGHVSIDIFYQKLSPHTQAIIQILGTLTFLMPVCIVILTLSWDYVISSWSIREVSREAGGLPYIYLLKTLLITMPACILLQGVSEVIKNSLFLFDKIKSEIGDASDG
jgi:TRAP-type mannitol/chloroaromatic compound transport system permease small subunit